MVIGRGVFAAVSWLALTPVAHAQGDATGLLFHVSGSRGTTADTARGVAVPIFQQGVEQVPDGATGPGLRMDDKLTLAWSAPGNMLAQRGTLSFFLRPRTQVDSSPFAIFRVGTADSTSWDATFLRIDWNGHGFDAFVTDTNLARTHVSWRSPTIPAADRWIHIAFAWDEVQGVTLWINGKRVASKQASADYDQALFGFGPFQRVISPQKVESGLNYMRSGDIDEVKVFDHMVSDAEAATLAAGQPAVIGAQPARTLADPVTRAEWRLRYGWDRITGAADPEAERILSVRRVEFGDTRDQKEKAFRGADGIRETTWPGVYNRSRLAGRDDYFILPDWNVYSTAGQVYSLTLPDEPWNQIEIAGAAHGTLSFSDGKKSMAILKRAPGSLRTSSRLPETRRGGALSFRNAVQETPIQEIGAYLVSTIDAPPDGYSRLDYKVDPGASPKGYASLEALTDRIAGRFPADERATVVALPKGAPVPTPTSKPSNALPVVHVLIPATFRDQPAGEAPRRFSYGWSNLNAGLDGVLLALPPLDLAPDTDGLIPLNIRLHDPLWPDRDLIDVIVKVRPKVAQKIWLDSRDRFLRNEDSVSLTIASADPHFGRASLSGMGVSLLFKDADAAKREHVADRLEQARDELASLVEEQPSTRLYPVWDRFERDVGDVLRIDPDNAKARALWVEKNPEQPAGPPIALASPPAGVPAWAFRQVQDLSLYRQFVDWWIDHRQLDNGEFGGGLSDDTDLVNLWVGLGLMGVEPERIRRSQRAVLDATFANGMWDNGLSFIQTDQLHSYEEGINTLAQAMMLSWGDPIQIERAMAVARNYPLLIETNGAGHAHFVSAWFSGSQIDRNGPLGWQYPYSFLITHPGLLLVDYNGAPPVRSLLLSALDGWLAHSKQDAAGNLSLPQDIEWKTDAARGRGVVSAAHNFWAAYRWTGDARYLRALEPAGMNPGSLTTLFMLNADALAQVPGGNALARRIAYDPKLVADGGYDPNLGTVGAPQIAKFIRWQESGDNAILAALYEDEVRRTMRRMYVLTEAELWSDRVAVPSELLQRARMGGVAHLRNNYYPGNLVSWRFDRPDIAEKVGIMIPHGDPAHFRVIAFNMSDRLVTATMVGGMLAPGSWRVTHGTDTDGDNRADRPEAGDAVQLERGLGTELRFPPGKTIVYEFTQEKRGDDPATRPDIGISAEEVTLHNGALQVRLHSLGVVATSPGTISVTDETGASIGEARFPGMAAPSDLMPKTHDVRIRVPAGARHRKLEVSVMLDGTPREVTLSNNRVSVTLP